MPAPAIEIADLCHAYGKRRALDNLSLTVDVGEIFALLGPNGSGKTTLFRALSTLTPIQQGAAKIFGLDLVESRADVREAIGVVFQAPGLDKKLTVIENLRCQAALYGMAGTALSERIAELLHRLDIADRSGEMVETLSGGLRRRVELAKGMLHRPRLLLLDEPSTGLDPGARADLWACLTDLRNQFGVTVVMTTHLLEEAEKADRIAILNEGQMVACGEPAALKEAVGGDTITIETSDPAALAKEAKERWEVEAQVASGAARLTRPDGHRLMTELAEAFAGRFSSIHFGPPTLEDVFIAKTGRRFWQEGPEE